MNDHAQLEENPEAAVRTANAGASALEREHNADPATARGTQGGVLWPNRMWSSTWPNLIITTDSSEANILDEHPSKRSAR